MLRIVIAAGAAVTSLILSGSGLSSTAATKLLAQVGPGPTIALTTVSGRRIRTLPPGTYSIVVSDRSSAYNFRLVGPSVNRATGLRFRGGKTWLVRLRPGDYTYRSDGKARMTGAFTVTR